MIIRLLMILNKISQDAELKKRMAMVMEDMLSPFDAFPVSKDSQMDDRRSCTRKFKSTT